jgi:hypothetical protein
MAMKEKNGCPMCAAGHPGNHGGYHREDGKPAPAMNQMMIPQPKTGKHSTSIAPGGGGTSRSGMTPGMDKQTIGAGKFKGGRHSG